MKLIKLTLLISLSGATLSQKAWSFGGYSQFKIPQGTFDTKIEANGTGMIWTFNDSVYCYKCTGLIAMTSNAVKKIVECKEGDCKETVYDIKTGKQVVSSLAHSTHINPNTPQNGLNTTFLGLNRQYLYISGAIALISYILYKCAQRA